MSTSYRAGIRWSFILTSNNAYAIRNDNGSFDIYLYGEYLETTNSLEEYGTFPIYDSKEKLTHWNIITDLIFLTIFSLFFYFNITVPTSATTISNIEPYYKFAEQNNILPYSDACIWVYKSTNGKLYKRLYNRNSNEWVSDWIYVKDLWQFK